MRKTKRKKSSTSTPALDLQRIRSPFQEKLRWVFGNFSLYVMLAVPLTIAILFRYLPIAALTVSFRDYNSLDGLWNSPWVGWKWFETFLTNPRFWKYFENTMKVSFYTLLFGFPAPIILALSLNEVRSNRFKRSVQTISYLPYFVSTVIVVGMMAQILSPTTGIVNSIRKSLGAQAINFRTEPAWFIPMYVISGIWSNVGYSSILYLSALTGIDPELYDAATVDGAGRWGRLRHITIPGILPTILILLLMNFGTFLNVGFEKAILMQNSLNIDASEIVGTYIYKIGLIDYKYGLSSAVGLFQSVVNLIIVTAFNMLTRKVADISLW